MKLFKKAILGLSLVLFAIQSAHAGILSRISNFNKVGKILYGLIIAGAGKEIFNNTSSFLKEAYESGYNDELKPENERKGFIKAFIASSPHLIKATLNFILLGLCIEKLMN